MNKYFVVVGDEIVAAGLQSNQVNEKWMHRRRHRRLHHRLSERECKAGF